MDHAAIPPHVTGQSEPSRRKGEIMGKKIATTTSRHYRATIESDQRHSSSGVITIAYILNLYNLLFFGQDKEVIRIISQDHFNPEFYEISKFASRFRECRRMSIYLSVRGGEDGYKRMFVISITCYQNNQVKKAPEIEYIVRPHDGMIMKQTFSGQFANCINSVKLKGKFEGALIFPPRTAKA